MQLAQEECRLQTGEIVRLAVIFLFLAVVRVHGQEDSPCQLETQEFVHCFIDVGRNAQACNECIVSALEGREDGIVGTSCNELDGFFCNISCRECEACQQETNDRIACLLRDISCPLFQCPPPATALPSPTTPNAQEAEDEDICPELAAPLNACLASEITTAQGNECLACLESINTGNPSCQANEEEVCISLPNECGDDSCGPCLDELRDFFICGFREQRCPNFSCSNAQDNDNDGVTIDCDAESDAFFDCFDATMNARECDDCIVANLEDGLMQGTRCSEADEIICNLSRSCPACDGCDQESSQRLACVVRDVSCPLFQCPTAPPIPATQSPASIPVAPSPSLFPTTLPMTDQPAVAPSPTTSQPTGGNKFDDCQGPKSSLNECLLSAVSLADGEECQKCAQDSFPTDHVGCFSIEGSEVCNNLNRCQECGVCLQQATEYLSCQAGTFYLNCQIVCSNNVTERSSSSIGALAAGFISAAVVLILFVAIIAAIFYCRRKTKRKTNNAKPEHGGDNRASNDAKARGHRSDNRPSNDPEAQPNNEEQQPRRPRSRQQGWEEWQQQQQQTWGRDMAVPQVPILTPGARSNNSVQFKDQGQPHPDEFSIHAFNPQ